MSTPTAQDFARAVAAELLSDPVVQSQAAIIVGHGQPVAGAGYAQPQQFGFAPQPQYAHQQYGFASGPAPQAAPQPQQTKTVVVYGGAPPAKIVKKVSKLHSFMWAVVGFVAGVAGTAWLVDRNPPDCH